MNDEPAIQERLLLLTNEFSRAEIARRTNTPKYQVSRYLSGTRVPANFCGALTRELGINPAWLLTGEGSIHLNDTSDETHKLSRNLTDLVNTMNHVSRMKIGALAGKDYFKALRELDEALRSFDGTKKQLSGVISPIFRDMLERLHSAIEARAQVKAKSLRDACIQASRLSMDDELDIAFDYEQAHYERVYGDSNIALEHLRKGLLKHILRERPIDDEFIARNVSLCESLLASSRMIEAERSIKMALALTIKRPDLKTVAADLRAFFGRICIERGGLKQGLRLFQMNVPHMSESRKELYRAFVWRAQIFSGLMTLGEAFAQRDLTNMEKTALANVAIGLEDLAALDANIELIFRNQSLYSEERGFQLFYAKLLTKAHAGKSRELLEALDERLKHDVTTKSFPQPIKDIEFDILRCQICRLSGDKKQALEFLDAYPASRCKLPPNLSVRLWVKTILWRNAIALLEGGKNSRARNELLTSVKRTLRRYIKNGYAAFESILPLGEAEAK